MLLLALVPRKGIGLTSSIAEEFGVTNDQLDTYEQWWSAIVDSGLTGDLIWQAGSVLSTGATADDGFAVYPTGTVYPAMESAAAALKTASA